MICYALAMANELGIDVSQALADKMVKNAQKYPADEYRGRWGAGDERAATNREVSRSAFALSSYIIAIGPERVASTMLLKSLTIRSQCSGPK